jgi:hypothetical protein
LRFAAAFVVVLACLVAPGTAAAHSRTPTVALDYRLQLSPRLPAGVHALVIDGDRALRVSVDPGTTAVVRGLLGEGVLRFDANGVWVNAASPTAAADKLVPAHASGWVRVSHGRTLTWHDHRLAPPPLRPGAQAPWALELVVDGKPAQLTGTFTRVARPALWPWLAAAALVSVFVAELVRKLPRRRVEVATALAGLAAIGALVSSTGFATGDAIARRAQWLEVASAVVLALVAGAALVVGDRRLRIWAAMVVGVVAAALALGTLSVFLHGVVISSLSPLATRAVTALALVAGAAAAIVAVLTPTPGGHR